MVVGAVSISIFLNQGAGRFCGLLFKALFVDAWSFVARTFDSAAPLLTNKIHLLQLTIWRAL
jgi:hypothetical protein